MAYGYRCPSCRTPNALHQEGCQYAELADGVIEEVHIDIISSLSLMRLTEAELKGEVDGGWTTVHDDVLDLYRTEGRITTQQRDLDTGGTEDVLYLRTPEEYRAQLVPTEVHIETVWERGPVDGCLDHSLVAIVSWHEWQDFEWEETRERVVQWLRDTGAWERGDWEEASPEQAVDGKRHIFDGGYGWKSAAQQAKSVIDNTVV